VENFEKRDSLTIAIYFSIFMRQLAMLKVNKSRKAIVTKKQIGNHLMTIFQKNMKINQKLKIL
jgi:hypothetical protein